ncbi:MAG TPA: chemotaxis protein CheA [Fimbriimonadaceae bacterium]|nr:chemotaxis protein CheA [Fimbriimonadaceae bacterium]
MNIDISAFQQAFFDEAADLIADFETNLLSLEDHPDSEELLNTIFRCAHSIKGGSATFGFPAIAKFTHSLETLLDQVRDHKVILTPELTALLFEALDQVRQLFAVAKGEAADAADDADLIRRLESAAVGGVAAAVPAKAKPDEGWGVWSVAKRYRMHIAPGADVLRKGADPMLLLSGLADEADILSIRCDESRLPTLEALDPETCYLAWDLELVSDREPGALLEAFDFIAEESEITIVEIEAEAQAPTAVEAASGPRSSGEQTVAVAKPEAATLRVSADKLDRLINLVGEMVINQSMLSEATQNFTTAKLPRLLEAVASMERASRELQERAMAIRLVPIRQAFARFPRLVRDFAASSGKQIELKTSGDETELDRTMIEAIADPLMHLVRNSMDHGLETTEERIAAGKPAEGSLWLRALQEGGNIIIEVADDGRGLDRDRILKKARERGLLAGDAPEPSNDTIYAYIFEPGFSTAAEVTDISGRGVGMDIVRRSLQAVNGAIGLTTTPGQGTCIRIRLPLTMAILEGLSLSVGNEVYVVALTSIVESIQPRSQDVHLLSGRDEVVSVRGEVLPLVRLHAIFGSEPNVTDPSQGLLVILENDGRKAALLVDELIGQSQVVIKSIEANHRKVDGIAGATILGDGRVALILDVSQLLRMNAGLTASAA